MNKKITAVTLTALMVLTMFTALVPAASAVEQVEAPYEFYAYIIGNISDATDDVVNLNSSKNPSILYYDLDEAEGNEELSFTIDAGTDEINGSTLIYNTTIYPDENGNPYIAWLGAPYFVVDNASDFYLSELLWDDEPTDDILLRVGETLTLKEGVTVTPQEIDVDGGEAWFSVSQDGEEVESSVTKEGTAFEWLADLNDNGEDDNAVVRFYVETVFAGMNTNLVKINETWQVSTDVVVVEDNDKDTIDDFVIDINPTGNTLSIELDDKDDDIGLKKDGTISFLNDRFSIRLNDDGDIAAVTRTLTEPDTYELYAYIIGNITLGPHDVHMNSSQYPSILYYDLDEAEGNEEFSFTIDAGTDEINGSTLIYNTTIYPDENGNPYIAWLGAPYFVVDNASDFYLSELLWDDEPTDDILLRVGETLTLKEGVTVTPQEIDVDGGEAWFSVSQDGEEVESSVTKEGTAFEWLADLNDNGEDDNAVVRFYVETVFAGMNTNLVKINETWQVSTDVVVVEDNDKDTIDDYIIDINPTGNTLSVELDDKDDDIGLKKDGVITFLNRFNIRLNEDGDIAAVVKIIEVGGGAAPTPTGTATPTDTVDANVTATPIGTVDANVTATATTPPTPEPTPTPTKEPGFEAVFAVAGLLAVAYLVLRQRE